MGRKKKKKKTAKNRRSIMTDNDNSDNQSLNIPKSDTSRASSRMHTNRSKFSKRKRSRSKSKKGEETQHVYSDALSQQNVDERGRVPAPPQP